MNPPDIRLAKSADLRGSYDAMLRAAKRAREIAIRTNTGIIIVRDGKTVFVSAEELRKEAQEELLKAEQPQG